MKKKPIILESINLAENKQRRYGLAITRSLFGEHCVIRARGRIGGPMKQEIRNFSDYVKAENHHDRILAQKIKRGYKVVS